ICLRLASTNIISACCHGTSIPSVRILRASLRGNSTMAGSSLSASANLKNWSGNLVNWEEKPSLLTAVSAVRRHFHRVSQHTLRWQSGFILRKKVTTIEFAKNFRAARVALLWYLVRARASPIDARNLSDVFADSDCCLITNAIWASLIPRQY